MTELQLTYLPVGSRSRWCFRLLPSPREALPYPELCAHVHGCHLDALVLDYQTQEHLVSIIGVVMYSRLIREIALHQLTSPSVALVSFKLVVSSLTTDPSRTRPLVNR
jgi:hypothetical protein